MHFDWQKMYDFIWKFRLEAPPSLTMGTLGVMLPVTVQTSTTENK